MRAGAQQHRLPEPAPGPSSALRQPARHYPQQHGQSARCPGSVSAGTPLRCALGFGGFGGGKLCSPGALTQGRHAAPLLGAGEISCLCQILRPVPISASIRDIKFSADSAEGRVCFIGPWSLVTEATQPIWLLGAGLEARKFLTAPSKGSVPEVGADSSTACSLL